MYFKITIPEEGSVANITMMISHFWVDSFDMRDEIRSATEGFWAFGAHQLSQFSVDCLDVHMQIIFLSCNIGTFIAKVSCSS